MNLLDPELMPYTKINTSTFPAYDPNLAHQAPPVGSPGYDRAIVEFVRQYAPDEYGGQPLRFFQTFASQVDLATAFPSGGNPDLLPGVNLELAGAVTSRFFMQYNPAALLGLNRRTVAGNGYALCLQAPLGGRRTSGWPADTRGPADVLGLVIPH